MLSGNGEGQVFEDGRHSQKLTTEPWMHRFQYFCTVSIAFSALNSSWTRIIGLNAQGWELFRDLALISRLSIQDRTCMLDQNKLGPRPSKTHFVGPTISIWYG